MRQLLLGVVSFLMLMVAGGCKKKPSCQLQIPIHSEITGLNSPIQLQRGETTVFLRDYVLDPMKVDSVIFTSSELRGYLSSDHNQLSLRSGHQLSRLSNCRLWIEGFGYDILVKKSEKVDWTFRLDPSGNNYKKVEIAGDMNGWNPKATSLSLNNGEWEVTLELEPGSYQYQMVVDDKWILDPGNSQKVDNNSGGFNSLVVVPDERAKAPVLYTLERKDGKIALMTEKNPTEVLVYWENTLLPSSCLKFDENRLEIPIPVEAKEKKRSFFRVFTYNNYGLGNDLLIPLEYGEVVNDPKLISRFDKEGNIMYFMLVDRFLNGDPSNDAPLKDKDIHPKANYMGGDLQGVTDKITDGYFKWLGVNTIWLSPITQNPLGAFGFWPNPKTRFSGYHGYWPISSSKVDFRFGTGQTLKTLVESAHAGEANVIVDYVANHVHQEHPVYQQHPDWATDLYLPDGSLNTEKWDEYRLTTWFDTFLPTLDFSKPEVVETMTDSALYWLEKFNLDGFRHDATKHIPEEFWRNLTFKIKSRVVYPQNKRLYQVGETYGSRELINSYIGSGMLDAQFDFSVYDDAVATFARPEVSFKRLSKSLALSLKYYGSHNLMGYISGNHDRARFISYASGDVRFDEDAKAAGWTRQIVVSDSSAYGDLEMLHAFNMTIPGIPVIYYGDEYGSPGGNDPDNRRMMQFEGLTSKEDATRETVRELIHLRRNHMALMYGDFKELEVSDSTWVFARTFFNETAIVAFNKSEKPVTISVKEPRHLTPNKINASFGSMVKLIENGLEVTLDPNSFDVLFY